MKAIEQYFHVILWFVFFTAMYKTLLSDHVIEGHPLKVSLT